MIHTYHHRENTDHDTRIEMMSIIRYFPNTIPAVLTTDIGSGCWYETAVAPYEHAEASSDVRENRDDEASGSHDHELDEKTSYCCRA